MRHIRHCDKQAARRRNIRRYHLLSGRCNYHFIACL